MLRSTGTCTRISPPHHSERAIAPMREAGGGSIVNVASISGHHPAEGTAAYAVSKFGVRGLTKVAALELGRYEKHTIEAVVDRIVVKGEGRQRLVERDRPPPILPRAPGPHGAFRPPYVRELGRRGRGRLRVPAHRGHRCHSDSAGPRKM